MRMGPPGGGGGGGSDTGDSEDTETDGSFGLKDVDWDGDGSPGGNLSDRDLGGDDDAIPGTGGQYTTSGGTESRDVETTGGQSSGGRSSDAQDTQTNQPDGTPRRRSSDGPANTGSGPDYSPTFVLGTGGENQPSTGGSSSGNSSGGVGLAIAAVVGLLALAGGFALGDS